MARAIRRVLVANRGEIAVRVLRACRELGIETVLVTSDADRRGLATHHADDVVCIGPGPASESYLRREAVITVALAKRVDAIHPGYGFLSEDAEFARLCQEHGLRFIGPRPDILGLFGNKVEAKAAARSAGVPLAEASAALGRVDEAASVANTLGFPVVLKAVKGGGGTGMRVAWTESDVREAFGPASADAAAAFGDGGLYLERFLPRARHVEVQIAGDGNGAAIHLGDRDCTIQRRHQKLIEEAPAACLPREMREGMREAAVRLGKEVGYDSVGTVEFVVDPERRDVSFLEVNARLQVEHGVTEEVTGVDLVKMQIGLAEPGSPGLPTGSVRTRGSAIECRLNAEDPNAGFRPGPGLITSWQVPAGKNVRVDTHCYEGYEVPPYYDSLLAKVICRGETRDSAIEHMLDSLARFGIGGIPTTRELLSTVMNSAEFRSCRYWTTWLEESLAEERRDRRLGGARPCQMPHNIDIVGS